MIKYIAAVTVLSGHIGLLILTIAHKRVHFDSIYHIFVNYFRCLRSNELT